jgi:hypothetical protein
MSTNAQLDQAEAAGFDKPPDVNLDNIAPGQTFQATWGFKNTGHSIWNANYKFVHTNTPHPETTGYPHAIMAAYTAFAFSELGVSGEVRPGETVYLTLSLTAPTTAATHATTWQLQTPDGRPFGPVRWLRAIVINIPQQKKSETQAPIQTKPKAPRPSPDSYNGPKVTFVAGLHGPGDSFTWNDDGFRRMLTKLNMPVKFMSDGDRFRWYKEFHKPELNLVRVFWKPDPNRRKTAQQAWDEDIRDGVLNFYKQGARNFEVHNEPRLGHEGMGHQWKNGAEFGDFLRGLMLIIKKNCPEARLWYPGESPGVPWTDQFGMTLPAYKKVSDLCYGLCQHAYAGDTKNVGTAVAEIVGQVRDFHAAMKAWDKPIIVSESSVNRAATSEFRAKVYTKVAQELAQIPGVQGIFWYISHWNPPPGEVANKEGWYGTDLPDRYKRLNTK